MKSASSPLEAIEFRPNTHFHIADAFTSAQTFRFAFTEPLFSFQSASIRQSLKQNYLYLKAQMNRGNYLLSHTVPHAVSSILRSLTTVFGMGTGVASSLDHHKQSGITLKPT